MLFGDKDEAKGGNFKVKSVNVFCIDDPLLGNERRYRKVFDRKEVHFIYCEFNFYNKLFDEEDWEMEVTFECIDVQTNKSLCKLNKKIKVDKSRNEYPLREGWGTKKANWWKPGQYKWKVFVDGKESGSTDFFITSYGAVTNSSNPYFTINAIKLFESGKVPEPVGKREYLLQFKSKGTRYINAQFEFDFLLDAPAFPLELHIRIKNDSGYRKGKISFFKKVVLSKKKQFLDAGYGSERGDFWKVDNYIMEVVFMDVLIASIPFKVGEEKIVSDTPIAFTTVAIPEVEGFETKPELTFEEATADLEALIGLTTVKKEITDLAAYLQFLKVRKEKGLEPETEFNLHSVFVGNPGTGKTTVAKMLGNIYHSLGLLEKPTVFEFSRADLVGEFIGQTAPKVKKALIKAKSAVFFIDEAYSLTDRGDDKKDFGREVIEVLLKELSEGTHKCAIIFAGYPKQMSSFLDSNPGLSSRLRNIIHFPDYTPDELLAIGKYTAEKKGIKLAEDAEAYIYKNLVSVYRDRDSKFGNARYINGIIEESKENLALRVTTKNENLDSLSAEVLSTITLEDTKPIFKNAGDTHFDMPIDEALLQDAFSQLNALIGLEKIKSEIQEWVKLVKYYQEVGKNVSQSFSLHTVFIGNPGTGKTTVARLIVQFFKALGILERGHLVEVDRKDLVAGFVGQTAIKTNEVLDKAMGGGLFIDEAYALTEGRGNDFGREAVETLLKRMEDDRGKFMLIVAGYPKEMNRFLEANPGLMSRFDRQIKFEDYSAEALVQIALLMFEREEMMLEPAAKDYLMAYLENLLSNKHEFFGNARTVRKIVEQTVRRQHLRMADLPGDKRTEKAIKTILLSDIQSVKMPQEEEQRKGIGFRK